jgi:tetratricopeptide (TPR) repeat protein
MKYVVGVVDRRNNPYDTAFCDYMAAIMLVLAQRPEEARIRAERSISLSEKHGFPQFAAISRIALGRALADLERADEGVKLIGQGIEGMNGTGSRVAMTMYLTWLGETLLADNQPDEALATFDRALDYNTQEKFFRPETLRLRAELLASLGRQDEARRDLQEANAGARRMGARTFEQRITLSSQRLSLAD